jgi:predicted nucleic acid-binding protein
MLISLVMVAELRCGALRAAWGGRRQNELEATIRAAKIVWPGRGLASEYARLQAEWVAVGHSSVESRTKPTVGLIRFLCGKPVTLSIAWTR